MSEGYWRPDPSGRYRMRYWDGTAWTQQVMPQEGPPIIDPLPLPLPAVISSGGSGSAQVAMSKRDWRKLPIGAILFSCFILIAFWGAARLIDGAEKDARRPALSELNQQQGDTNTSANNNTPAPASPGAPTTPGPASPNEPAPASVEQLNVRAGAQCAPVGGIGSTSSGYPMTCAETDTDGHPYSYPRWIAS